MSAVLLGRHTLTVAEYCALTGQKPNTVHRRIREGRLQARDLNAGTGKRPRWRIPVRELRRTEESHASQAQ